jgi:hypothetical protein
MRRACSRGCRRPASSPCTRSPTCGAEDVEGRGARWAVAPVAVRFVEALLLVGVVRASALDVAATECLESRLAREHAGTARGSGRRARRLSARRVDVAATVVVRRRARRRIDPGLRGHRGRARRVAAAGRIRAGRARGRGLVSGVVARARNRQRGTGEDGEQDPAHVNNDARREPSRAAAARGSAHPHRETSGRFDFLADFVHSIVP